jgi:hypothetical protein
MLAYSPGERGWMIAGEDVPGELVSFVPAEDAVHVRGVKVGPVFRFGRRGPSMCHVTPPR